MKVELVNGKSPIGETIRAVAQAHSSRLFKTAQNTEERSAFVFLVIRSEIFLALYDLGVHPNQLMREIDPTDAILAQMIKDGYVLGFGMLMNGGTNA